MTSTIQIARHGTLDDLLFRGKNKAYGAYPLRQEYDRRLRSAFIIFMSSIVFISFFSFVYLKFKGHTSTSTIISCPSPYVDETIIQREPIKDIIKPKIDLPAAKPITKSIMDVPPVIQDNVEDDDNIKPNKDLDNTDVPISNVNQDGIDAVPSGNAPISNGGGGEIEHGGVNNIPDEPLDFAEIMPEFPGGDIALNKFLQNRIKYPDFEHEMGIEGTVVINFVVNKDGSISDISIAKKISEGFEQQALNAVYSMPKWKAGIQNGHPVKVSMSLPIKFAPPK